MRPLGEQQPDAQGSPHPDEPLEPPLDPPLVEPPEPPQLVTRVRSPASAAQCWMVASMQLHVPSPARRQHEPEQEVTLLPVLAALDAAFGPV